MMPIGKALERKLRKLQDKYNATPKEQKILRDCLVRRILKTIDDIEVHFGEQEAEKARNIVLNVRESHISADREKMDCKADFVA